MHPALWVEGLWVREDGRVHVHKVADCAHRGLFDIQFSSTKLLERLGVRGTHTRWNRVLLICQSLCGSDS